MAFVNYDAPKLSVAHFPDTLASKIAKWAFRILCIVIALSAIPLGANRAWASLPLLCVLFSLGLVWILGYTLDGGKNLPVPQMSKILPAVVLYGLFLLFAWGQTTTMIPAAWAHPLWKGAQAALTTEAGTPALAATIALDPALTGQSILRFISYAVVFIIAAIMTSRSKEADRLLYLLAISSCLYAGYGLTEYFTGNDNVAWTSKIAYFDSLTSTFVNRNSYATFAGMGAICLVTLVLRAFKPAYNRGYEFSRIWRNVVYLIFQPQVMALLMGLFAVVNALLLTDSRAGIVCAVMGILGCLLLGFSRQLPAWGKFVLVAGLLLLMGTLVAQSDSGTLVRYAATDFSQENRLPVYKLVVQAIESNPYLGHGLGNFAAAFPLYRDSTVVGTYDRAHNDYLEMAFDVGIPAALLFYAALTYVLFGCFRAWKDKRRGKGNAVLALAISMQVALHALVDFSLQMPANAWWYALILGMGYAVYWKPSHRKDGRPL